jgi:hypothetical protein
MGHRPVAAGDAPAALDVPAIHLLIGPVELPKLDGKLPPRTARLAVPPGIAETKSRED